MACRKYTGNTGSSTSHSSTIGGVCPSSTYHDLQVFTVVKGTLLFLAAISATLFDKEICCSAEGVLLLCA